MQVWQFSAKDVENSIAQNMQTPTNYLDTHPALSDRLKAIKAQPYFEYDVGQSAAHIWFKERLGDILKDLDKLWVIETEQSWQILFDEGKSAVEQLKKLEAKGRELTQQEQVEKANIINFLYGQDKALPLYHAIYQKDATEPAALYNLGVAFIADKNKKGIQLLLKLLDNEAYVIEAGEVLYEYYLKENKHEQANKVLLKMESQQDNNDALLADISTLSDKDVFIESDLSEEERQQVITMFKGMSALKNVWIAKKELPNYPEHRLAIIVYQLHNKEDEEKFFYNLESQWLIDSLYFALNSDNKRLAKKIKKVAKKVV
jgi:hypothetical protein